MSSSAVFEIPIPRALRAIGARWRDGRSSYRMTWGEMTLGRGGFALELCLFGDPPHFSLRIHGLWVNLYVQLPFLRRFAWEPEEMMESWGASYSSDDGVLFLHWGAHSHLTTMPWRNWTQVSHDVRRIDGTWAPFVGSWEHDKVPDERHTETYPYRYLLSSGEKQEVTATIHAERRIRRLRLLRWTRAFQRVTHSIDVQFSDEVGEGAGSWKGGCVGCGWDLRPNETPLQCLRRMERERRFAR
jgi:hypothetical protein